MKSSTQPLACYIATITQNGQLVRVVHRCGNAECPTNRQG